MVFQECIKSVSTNSILKRIASAYVVDYRKLSTNELIASIVKAAPQYYHKENIFKALNALIIDNDRNNRVVSAIFLEELLLNKDNFTEKQKTIDNEIIAYEQNIINLANEYEDKNPQSKTNLFKYILECAWDHEGTISVNEKNLIEKIRKKLQINMKNYQIIEASISKYPKDNNVTHNRDEIGNVRRALQSMGLIFAIRDVKGVDYDVIPEEIAKYIREFYNVEIKRSSYKELLNHKLVKSKGYLQNILKKAHGFYNPCHTLPILKAEIIATIKPSNVLGGFSPNDGLDRSQLAEWLSDIGLSCYGTKPELIDRILKYYDSKKQIIITSKDERELYYQVFENLASRDLNFLRKQEICNKDIECERKFEDATNYLFEKIFKHKPLMLKGNEHPDGMLSYNDKLIMWDNKSKETEVNLADHIKQFDRYINASQKSVSVFIVIGPSFTPNSIAECAKYILESDTSILLITAKELKGLAQDWLEKHSNDEESFPLGFFKQNGRFDRSLVLI